MTRRRFERAHEELVRESVARGEHPSCPRCSRALERQEVPPREGVAYVRRRRLYLCGACGGSVLVDRPRSGWPDA